MQNRVKYLLPIVGSVLFLAGCRCARTVDEDEKAEPVLHGLFRNWEPGADKGGESPHRVELPEERLTADFNDDSILELSPDLVGPSITRNSGIVGGCATPGVRDGDLVTPPPGYQAANPKAAATAKNASFIRQILVDSLWHGLVH